MILNKKGLAMFSIAIMLLVSFHTADAFSLKKFLNNIFSVNKAENTLPAAASKAFTTSDTPIQNPASSQDLKVAIPTPTLPTPPSTPRLSKIKSIGITLTYPNNGEIFVEGQQIQVTWTSVDIPSASSVFIALLVADPNNNILGDMPLNMSTPNDGQQTITLPTIAAIRQFNPAYSSVTQGRHFKILVGTDMIDPPAYDSSDDFFSIMSPTSCVVNSFTSNPMTVNAGGSSTLSWSTQGCMYTSIDSSTVPLSGSSVVGPLSQTTTYTLYAGTDLAQGCTSYMGYSPITGQPCSTASSVQVTTTVVVTSTPPTQCVINSFIANPTTVGINGQTTLSWSTSGCTYVYINNQQTGMGTSGSQVYPTQGQPGTVNFTLSAAAVILPGCSPANGYMGYSTSNGQPCNSTAQFRSVHVVVAGSSSNCSIDSFTVPASTTISSRLSIPVSWSSNCSNVLLIANSGSYYQPHLGNGAGAFTFSGPVGTAFSSKDNSVDVTLIATSGTEMISITKSVPIINLPSPGSNQCAISSLIATPSTVSSGSPQTTLSWKATTGCIVYVDAWKPLSGGLFNSSHVFKPGTLYFNATDSVVVTPSASTTYYVTAQAGTQLGANNMMVLSAKSVDVQMQSMPACVQTSVGSVLASLNSNSPSSSVIHPGSINVELSRFDFKNTGSNDICGLNAIQIGSDLTPNNFLTKFRLLDASTGSLIGQEVLTLDDNGSYYYEWITPTNPIVIPAGVTKTFKLIADVLTSAPIGSVKLGIYGNNFVSPGAYTSGLPVSGNVMTIQ